MNEKMVFGHQDHSYQSAGGETGLMKLSKDFYGFMDSLPAAKVIRAMHPSDLTLSIEKLALFLCGWLGGPRLFQNKFGPIHIPQRHSHLKISATEKEAWLLCMQKALENQPYDESFKDYLITQLQVPAARIQAMCEERSRT